MIHLNNYCVYAYHVPAIRKRARLTKLYLRGVYTYIWSIRASRSHLCLIREMVFQEKKNGSQHLVTKNINSYKLYMLLYSTYMYVYIAR